MYRFVPIAAALLAPAVLAAQHPKPPVDYSKADLIRVSSAYAVGGLTRFGGLDWLEDSVRFWYRSSGKTDRNVVYLVDPRLATKRVLFDNAKLAAALAIAADTLLDPSKMPAYRITDSAKTIEIALLRKRPWRCEIATYKCTALDSADFVMRQRLKNGPDWAARSRDKKWDVFSYRYNIYARPAALSDSDAVAARDSTKRARQDTTRARSRATANDSLPLPAGSIQLTMDGTRMMPYGQPPRDVKAEPIRPRRAGGSWSPDGRKITVQRYNYQNVRVYPLYTSTKDQPEDRSYFYAAPGDSVNSTFDLHILDVVDRSNTKVKDTPSPDINFGANPTWNKTSDRVLVLNSSRGYKRIRLSSIDARTGDSRVITTDSFPTWVEGMPFSTANGGDDIFVVSERDGWKHVYRFGPDGALKGQVESGAYALSSLNRVDSVAKQLYFTAYGKDNGVPYYGKLYRINYDGTALTTVTPEDADHEITFVPKAPYVIDTYSRPDTPPISVLRSTETGKVLIELARGDVDYLKAIGWSAPEIFQVKARDGVTDIWGLMYKPSNFDSTKVYPIIDHIYPGPQRGSVGNWTFAGTSEPRAMAELGFIVLQIDHQGSPKRSESFHDFYFGKMGDNGIPDHIVGIRQLAARYSWLDINRVGIYGHSGGGFASTDAMFRYPDFFKVGVSGAGNHHPATYGAFWAEKYQGLYNKAAYDEAANYTHAKNLKGKLLLMHGDMDNNVHPANTLKVVDALIKANKNFDMIIYPDAGHGLPVHSIRKRWDYFVTWLLGGVPPEDYEMSTLSPF